MRRQIVKSSRRFIWKSQLHALLSWCGELIMLLSVDPSILLTKVEFDTIIDMRISACPRNGNAE